MMVVGQSLGRAVNSQVVGAENELMEKTAVTMKGAEVSVRMQLLRSSTRGLLAGQGLLIATIGDLMAFERSLWASGFM